MTRTISLGFALITLGLTVSSPVFADTGDTGDDGSTVEANEIKTWDSGDEGGCATVAGTASAGLALVSLIGVARRRQ